jgi:NAD(P)-dependent dehydrogenase (short-subunit alcohol dehydrogenase family)
MQESRVVLITGCSSGIGRALAQELHKRGLRVYASARRPETLEDLTREGIQAIKLDVTSADDIQRTVAQIQQEAGRIDILVNNAGYGAMGPVAEMPMAEIRQEFETNVFAPLALIQAAIPHMIARRAGCIVNVGSVSGILTTPFAGVYCATKAALHSLSDALRMELAPFNIKVIMVQPGAIRSNFGVNALAAVDRVIRAGSHYQAVEEGIRARANASQRRATPSTELARLIADNILKSDPPAVIRGGLGSTVMPVMKHLLPTPLLDRLLGRQFGLHRLKS